jgi:hypothetical protein
MKLRRTALPILSLLVACAAAEEPEATDDDFSSNQATLLEFAFSGEVMADGNARAAIDTQMLFTIGQLNGVNSVGRLDKIVLTDIVSTRQADGRNKVTYKAKLPVAWGSKTALPTQFTFKLPKDAGFSAQDAFTTKYKNSCVDRFAHDVDTGSMWYYYRPADCTIDAADVVNMDARVSRATENSSGKYPEYDKVWADNELNVVAIFGKYKDGATSDEGITAYQSFIRTVRGELARNNVVTEPANATPGVSQPDVTVKAVLADGKKVSVTALLVDNVRTAGPTFDARYNVLSTNADLIVYNGHAGLGDNVRALARKGAWKANKYVIVFMNGCDTFAYVDGSLAETRARLNPDDPTGTKNMEFVTNALPAFFSQMSNATTTMFKGLLRYDSPMTYDQIFEGIDDSQVAVVTGEEDNLYTPSSRPPGGFQGIVQDLIVERGRVRKLETGMLPAGTYDFTLSGTGNADLFVKIGAGATSRTFTCKSDGPSATEACSLTLPAPSNVSVAVRAKTSAGVKFQVSKR